MTRPLVFLMPGQSSRDPAMFDRIAAVDARLAADHVTRLARAGVDPVSPACNRDIQLSVFAATMAWAALVARAGLVPDASAGHSLGEYAHLVVAGALAESDAWTLVDARGTAYDAGPDGIMAAVVPVGADELDLEGEAWLACDNSPSQVVVGGARDDVLRAISRLEEERFATATVIEDRVPMHTPRFAPVGPALRPALARAPWRPVATYWSNVLGAPVEDPTRDTIVELLARHVSEPVRWRGLVAALAARHPDAVFVEVGPRRVLSGLLRRAVPGATAFAVDPGDAPADVPARFAATLEEVRRARG